VEGRGTIGITTNAGNAKILQDVMLVLSLSHNFPSGGQLISGFSILFDADIVLLEIKPLTN